MWQIRGDIMKSNGISIRQRRIAFRFLVSLSPCLLVFLLCGCTSLSEYFHNGLKVGPNYKQASAPLAKDWIDAKALLDPADKRPRKDADDLTTWWKVFNDPVLDNLIDDAQKQNLTLRQAGFRILQARAQLGIVVGALFPQSQFASGGYERIGTSNEIAGGSSGGQSSRPRFFNQWNFGFALAWEMDFWGRFRRAVESADANLDASVFEYNDVLVTLLGDVATNYVQLRTLEKRIEYAKLNVGIQTETRDKAEARLKVDKNGALALDQAQALLKQTEAGISELEISLRLTNNRLCILLGIPPEDLHQRLNADAPAVVRIPSAAVDIDVGIPADLLRRRPDIRRAERQAAAVSAQIGIAESEFYPHITLAGTLGWSADSFKNLFRSSAFNGTFGPSAQWNILHYGRLVNNVRLQDARFQEALAAYQDRVLNAQQEVESGMVVFLKAQHRAKLQKESVEAAKKAGKIAYTVFAVNGVDFTTVSLIQQNLVQQQDTLAQAEGEIALGLIQLYKAVGGGWDVNADRCVPHVVMPQHRRHRAEELAPPSMVPATFGRPF